MSVHSIPDRCFFFGAVLRHAFSIRLRSLALPVLVLASPLTYAADFVYNVQPGDTVIGITQTRLAEASLWRKLARYNRLANPDFILPGQALRIPVAWLKRVAADAEVVELNGSATVTANGTTAPLRPGVRVAQGADMTTGNDGFVTLRLGDGSSVRIRSNTQMRVDALSRIPGTTQHQSLLRLISGRLEVLVEKLRGPATRFSIETPVGATAVRGTEFRVAADAAKGLQRTEVIEGSVAVAARNPGAQERAVGAGFGTIVEATGNVAPPVALLPAPALTQLPALQERPLVRFRLDPLERAVAYRGQIGSTPGFVTPLAEVVSAAPELRFQDLPDATYVLRVRAVDGLGIEGRDAEHSFRLKARPEPPIPSRPPRNAKVRGVSVDFSWSESTEAARYRYQLARDATFAAIVSEDSSVTGTTRGEPGPLAPGVYYWRVASVRGDGDRGPFGDPLSFTLLPPPAQPEPPLIGDNDVTFSWSGEPGQRFEFEMARDERFTVEFARHALVEPRLELPRPAPGSWYIRYRAIDSDGYIGPYTAPQRFTVPPCVVSAAGRCVGVGSGGVLSPQ